MAQDQRVEQAVFGRLLPCFLSPDPPRPMPGDGADPGAEAGRLLQLGQGLEGQEKSLLRQIFCGFPRTERLHRDHDDRAPVAGHECVERFEIAQKRVQYELLIADLWVSAALLCHSLHSSCKEETAPTRKDRRTAQLFSQTRQNPSRYCPYRKSVRSISILAFSIRAFVTGWLSSHSGPAPPSRFSRRCSLPKNRIIPLGS